MDDCPTCAGAPRAANETDSPSRHTAPVAGGSEPLPAAIGDYAVVRKLGEGGMGTVYLAEDAKLARAVAVKTLKAATAADPLSRERFLSEARAAAAVENDFVVPVWHIGTTADGTPFLAMPFLSGESLDARLRREPVAPADLVLKVARDVAAGLVAAHAKGLIHRDIKPGNVWLEGDPNGPVRRAKVLDFGLAHASVPGAPHADGGPILGTPAYMAPEQASGERVDARADLFSLGATLYRMATGQLPFRGATAPALLSALATDAPHPARDANPDLPPALAALIDRLLSKNPADRPATAADVVTELESVGASAASLRLPVPQNAWDEFALSETVPLPAPEPERPARRWPRVALGTALALTAVLVAAFAARPSGASAEPDAPALPEVPVVPVVQQQFPPANPERVRRAALYAIQMRGGVRVNGKPTEIWAAAELPPGEFKLTAVLLGDRQLIDPELALVSPDTALAAFAGTEHLTELDLYGTGAGDKGLAHFARNTGLKRLSAFGPGVTGAGLAPFAKCADLESLQITGTAITDADLAPFAELKHLARLYSGATKLTDAALKPFAVERFTELDLRGAKGIGNGTLERLKGANRLEWLILSDTRATDDGLKHLAGLHALKRLDVRGTGVTETGVKELAKALPKCAIEWNGGLLAPALPGTRRGTTIVP